MKLKRIRKAAIFTAVFFCLCGCAGNKNYTERKSGDPMKPADYSDAGNWLSLPEDSKDVDVFFLYPTCYFDGSEPWCSVADNGMRAGAVNIKAAHEGIFEAANFYAPFYRQLKLSYITSLGAADKVFEAIEKAPLIDAKNAFEYFLKNHNKGRPIIFASHSQGALVMSRLLFWLKTAHPDALERTIAAYLIGCPVTKEYCGQIGLPFAAGKDDTGVIVSWNTESPEAAEKNIVNPFTAVAGAIPINPVNWKRDETYADKAESLGSRIRFGGETPVDRPRFADAKLNLERGVVVTGADVLAEAPWPAGVLHRYDFDLFYYDFQQNVRDRIAAYKKIQQEKIKN